MAHRESWNSSDQRLLSNHRGLRRFTRNLSERNVLLFGIAMFLTFAAFNTSQNFATSSSNPRVGSISLGILYGVNTIACVIVPNIIDHILSVKASLIIGALTYVLFVAAYIHSIDIAQYITSGILGIGAAFLWISEGSFVTSCANEFEYEFLMPFNSELGIIYIQYIAYVHFKFGDSANV